jgi:hypothetical protein
LKPTFQPDLSTLFNFTQKLLIAFLDFFFAFGSIPILLAYAFPFLEGHQAHPSFMGLSISGRKGWVFAHSLFLLFRLFHN